MPNELPPIGPRPQHDRSGLPPLASRPEPTTGELPRLSNVRHDAERTRELPPPRFEREAPTAATPRPRPERARQPEQQRRPRTTGTPRAATWAAVILTAAVVGAGSARLAGDGSDAQSPQQAQQTNRPITNAGALESAIRSVQSAVVEVRVNRGFNGSQGSGVILQPQGLIVTNNHVIDGSSRVEVVTAAGQSIAAEVVSANPAEDLAILRPVTSPGTGVNLSPDTAGPPPSGQTVFAIGSPFGLQNTVTSGVVSAYRNEAGRPLIQFDAPVNPGNSGGGLFNLDGELIGIPTSIRSPVNGNVGIAFAVPATRVRAMLSQIR